MDARHPVSHLVTEQRTYFQSGATRSVNFRLEQLTKLKNLIIENEVALCDTLNKDLGKHSTEAKFTEVRFIVGELDYTIKHLKNWVKGQKVSTPFVMFPGKSQRLPEPKGCAFVIGPWNYPFQLVMGPLIGAIAAGNCAIIKPSEITQHTTALILKLINENFDHKFIHAIDVMPEEMADVLSNKFDHIFFTGGTRVAKIILHAAAEHLTPVTLELGGKSPCIVDETADLDYAAHKIIFGKMMNAGQTCIAPDYLYVHESVKKALLERLIATLKKFYGDHPEKSESFGRIVSEAHFQRLQDLYTDANIVVGGTANAETRYIAPTILDDVTWDQPVMREEIFGPILPVLTFSKINDVITTLNDKPKPLAFYLFSKRSATINLVKERASFGGACINDCLMQAVNPELPFGGVGNSGFGAYHGKSSFDVFSHYRSIYQRTFAIDFDFMYPPFSEAKERILSYFM